MTESSQTDGGLSSAAEELIARLRHHASVLSRADPDPAEVVAVADAVGRTADQYSSAVFERTGWGSPFTPPPDDVSDDVDSFSEEKGSGVGARIQVSADYVIEVVSEEELRRLVNAKELAVETGPGQDEGTAVDLIAALFAADGWDAAGYGEHVVHVHVADWSVGPAEETYLPRR